MKWRWPPNGHTSSDSTKKSWRKPVPVSGAITVRRWADRLHQ
ncbi:hypothetical protein [Bacillus subtilis]|nr:hypothetical protein [Bacillus subtilis]